MKYLIALTVFVFAFTHRAQATDCEGYIVKSNGDSVKGVVDVIYKKALIGKKEIDFGEMEAGIKFTEKDGRSQKIKAGGVNGYGFNSEGSWHHFEILDMQKNSGKKAPKFLRKAFNNFTFFVERVCDGILPVYKDHMKYGSDADSGPNGLGFKEVAGYDLYVKNSDGVFVEITSPMPGSNKKFKDFLEQYLKLEAAFLSTVDDKAKFSDAEEILRSYNYWKKKNS
jgi:hypothetical protein